jgi:hypothetical protein
MTVRMIVATALGTAVLAGAASAATSAQTTLRNCGTISVAGHSWAIVTAGVPCTSAKTLIRTLGARPALAVRIDPKLHMGMKCLDASGKGKRVIHCVSPAGDKQVIGGTKSP